MASPKEMLLQIISVAKEFTLMQKIIGGSVLLVSRGWHADDDHARRR